MRNNYFSSVERLLVNALSLSSCPPELSLPVLLLYGSVFTYHYRMMSWDFPSDLLKACVAMTATKHVFDKVESILHSSVNVYKLLYLSDETKDEDGECV